MSMKSPYTLWPEIAWRTFNLSFGLLVLTGATILALMQPLRPNPYAVGGLLSWDWWKYPIERNAFVRLPAVDADINDLHISADGQRIWAVGDRGLILHSDDGGATWTSQQVGDYVPVPIQPPGTTSGAAAMTDYDTITGQAAEEPAQQTEEPAQQTEEPAQETLEPAQQTDEASQETDEASQETLEPAQDKELPSENADVSAEQSSPPPDSTKGVDSIRPGKGPGQGSGQGQSEMPNSLQQSSPPEQAPEKGTENENDSTPSELEKSSGDDLGSTPTAGDKSADEGSDSNADDKVPEPVPFTLDIAKVQFVDDEFGMALAVESANVIRPGEVVKGYGHSVFVVTRDGGSNWSPLPMTLHNINWFHLVDRSHAMVASGFNDGLGESGTMLVHQFNPDSFENFQRRDTNFINIESIHGEANRIWIPHPVGMLMHRYTLVDGTFRLDSITTPDNFSLLNFIDGDRGWAVNSDDEGVSRIYSTTDGGSVWVPGAVLPVISTNMRINFISERVGYCLAFIDEKWEPDLLTFRTEDGGASWTPFVWETNGVPWWVSFSSIFSGESSIWRIASTVMQRSVDEGATWTTLTRAEMRDIRFTTHDDAWTVSARDIMMKTSDGGRIWRAHPIRLPVNPADLKLLTFIDDQRGWAGSDEILWATADRGGSGSRCFIGRGCRSTESK